MREKDPEEKLMELLKEEIVFINDHWWMKHQGWKEEQTRLFSINVVCNDTFLYSCADAIELMFDELDDLYEHHQKDPTYGSTVWCMKKRGQMPLKQLEDRIRHEGLWDLDSMNLSPNKYYEIKEEKV